MSHPLVQLLRTEETRKRLVTTLGLLAAYRIGFQIPIPGMSPEYLRETAQNAASTVFGLLSAFSGAAIGQTAIFSLGIMPYISASIIFSILVKVSPRLEAVQKEGAAGQKRISQWTRLVTVPIALLQSLLIWFTVFASEPGIFAGGGGPTLDKLLIVVLGLTAGAIVVMWIGELITEHGVGNGASLIIMAGIIATMPSSISQVFSRGDDPYDTILTLVVLWLAIVVGVVFIQKGERRIPIQYARLTRGRMVYGGQKHYLPLKVNMAGVMPIIFASALFAIPGVLLSSIGWTGLANLIQDPDGFIHVAGYLALVFFFCFFWNNLMFQPDDIANNLREHGSFIPGIRPGLKTSEEIGRVLNRITLAGAAFLAVVAVLPNFITARIPGLDGNLAYFLGGTSVLIVVGVAMDLVDKLNAQLVMRNYEGFMKGGKGPRGGSSAPGWASRRS
ncbi:MAG TPA: preprotein translocase subunit SecY [Planctomycetota bacterium]|nr:preprotein translocase subunit SecY [Planctomycetota bacterium]